METIKTQAPEREIAEITNGERIETIKREFEEGFAFLEKYGSAKTVSIFGSSKLQEGSIIVVSGLEKIAPKTKEMVSVLEKLEYKN